MTLPDERYRAVKWAEEFLLKLSDPKQTPRIPKEIRQQAWSILRHYPNNRDMDNAANLAPVVFQKEMEPLYRMVKQYEQDKENES
jgi:DNA-binding protein Fis